MKKLLSIPSIDIRTALSGKFQSPQETKTGIDYREFRFTRGLYLCYVLYSFGILFVLSYSFYRSTALLLLLSPGCLFLPFLFLPSLKKQRQEKLLAEFREFLSIFHSYLAAGYSAENAAELSYPELLSVTGENSYMASELRRFLQGLQQKRSLEDSLRQFAYRSGLEDIENFAEIFAIARHSGGDFLKIVRQSIEVIHDKSSILEEIKTNLSAKRYEQKLMNLIPIFLIWYLSFSSPDFFLPLFHTLPGRILMSFCLLLYLLSFKLSEKILSIEV